jgi:ABC-2 type transport system ATP-binding protein
VLGLFKPRNGTVRVFGKDPVEDPESVLGEIGYLSEVRDLPDWMKIGELMSYTKAFFPSWDDSFAEELRNMFELSLDQKVKTLSRGQRARAGLIAAIAHRPQLLVLDEPSSGLDPVVRRDILSAIIRTVADEGRTVLFSSHLLDEVQRVSDHVAMLHLGKMLLSSPMDEVLTSHHRLTVRFEQPLDSPLKLDAALRCEGEGREWTVLCNGERASVEAQLTQLNGEIVERASPTLDEIFVARMNG